MAPSIILVSKRYETPVGSIWSKIQFCFDAQPKSQSLNAIYTSFFLIEFGYHSKTMWLNWTSIELTCATRHPFKVLYFCVDFRELSHLTRDLSQAEKKINCVTCWTCDKMTTIFTPNDNFNHFEYKSMPFFAFAQLVTTFSIFSARDESRA